MKYLLSILLATQFVIAQERMKPEETEVWEPEPKVIQPGVYTAPPSDAVVFLTEQTFPNGEVSVIRAQLNGL